jgi:hypothetical protein
VADDYEDDEDRRPPRRRRRPEPDDDWDEDEYDDEPRPRRRRRPPPDDGMQYIVPVNTSALAILAGYVGLISVLCLPAPIALLLGVLALMQLKKNPKLHGHGRAWFAIVMGGIGTLCLAIGAIAMAVGAMK